MKELKHGDYRVKEEDGVFTIEIYSYYKTTPIKNFWGKIKKPSEKAWDWFTVDKNGNVLTYIYDRCISGFPSPDNVPPCRKFKSLKDAKEQINIWTNNKSNGKNSRTSNVKYHYI